MKKKPIVLVIILLSVFAFGKIYAQHKSIYDPAFKAKVDKDVMQFFKNAPQYRTAAYMPVYYDELSRTSIKTKPIRKGEKYIKLSSLLLLKKYNPELVRDNAKNFNPNTFNPLKYSFNFTPTKTIIYRVDNTPYIIVITPKK